MAPVEAPKRTGDDKESLPRRGNDRADVDAQQEADPPVIVHLKRLDDEFLELQRECDREVQAVERRFAALQRPVLEQRAKYLAGDDADEDRETGTPAVKSFWLIAMQNHPALEAEIEEWDAPVLEYLTNITKDLLDPNDANKGFKLDFHFKLNPYFENTVLTKEYYTEEDSPYTGDFSTIEVKATKIQWKPGKDVTTEIVKKKPKGGGAKKSKIPKEKKESRPSFFRHFFTNLRRGDRLPDDVDLDRLREMCDDSEDEDDDERLMETAIESDHDIGTAFRDNIVPFAVRWYTGEASPDDDFNEDEEEEEEDGEEEESVADAEDDEDDDDSGSRKQKNGRRGKGRSGGGAERGRVSGQPKAAAKAAAAASESTGDSSAPGRRR